MRARWAARAGAPGQVLLCPRLVSHLGGDTVRKRVLSRPVGVCFVGLLLVSLAESGCRPADMAAAPRPDLTKIDRLLRLMEQRLALMHDVARWKWNTSKPITDAQRG